MFNVNYNPDVLTCLANLSNDEVFTPPDVANKMLDQLPEELWSNKNITFLDPCTKSGIFLREITKRLLVGLEDEIPDLQERINHILTKQVFGIGITELTALLTRRSLYCSKNANQELSITDAFSNNDGNILYKELNHKWKNLKCEYCGASKDLFNRQDYLEQYAYNFIHTDNPKELFNMKFDVIIGNPPYQLATGGPKKHAKPLYNKFIENALKLNPTYLSMIIPSRWMGGGMGLDKFRKSMLSKKIKYIYDFIDSKDCFESVDIAGGICYFLIENNYDGPTEIVTNFKSDISKSKRHLDEFNNIFIRFNFGVSIVRKVVDKNLKSMQEIIEPALPFGLISSDRPNKKANYGDYILISSGGKGPVRKERVTSGFDLINKWKLMTSYASHDHGGQFDKNGQRRVLSRVEIMKPGEVCTQSYQILGTFENKQGAEKLEKYVKTKFVRFLIAMVSFSQHINNKKFRFVPLVDLNKDWDDKKLYEFFQLNKDEISSIEKTITEF